MKPCLVVVLSVYLLAFICVSPAHAYIDPGSGSMLLQLLLGGVAGLALALKLFWRRILSIFGARSGEDKETSDPDKPA